MDTSRLRFLDKLDTMFSRAKSEERREGSESNRSPIRITSTNVRLSRLLSLTLLVNHRYRVPAAIMMRTKRMIGFSMSLRSGPKWVEINRRRAKPPASKSPVTLQLADNPIHLLRIPTFNAFSRSRRSALALTLPTHPLHHTMLTDTRNRNGSWGKGAERMEYLPCCPCPKEQRKDVVSIRGRVGRRPHFSFFSIEC